MIVLGTGIQPGENGLLMGLQTGGTLSGSVFFGGRLKGMLAVVLSIIVVDGATVVGGVVTV